MPRRSSPCLLFRPRVLGVCGRAKAAARQLGPLVPALFGVCAISGRTRACAGRPLVPAIWGMRHPDSETCTTLWPSRPRDFRGMRHRWRLTDCFPCVFRPVDIEKSGLWRCILPQPPPFFALRTSTLQFYRIRASSTRLVPECASEMPSVLHLRPLRRFTAGADKMPPLVGRQVEMITPRTPVQPGPAPRAPPAEAQRSVSAATRAEQRFALACRD